MQVGDKVRVSTKRHGDWQFNVTGIITEINEGYDLNDEEYLPIKVEYDSPQRFYNIYIDDNNYSYSDLELLYSEMPYDPTQQGDTEDDI